MITYVNKNTIGHYAGNTGEAPEGVQNGSIFYEMDSGLYYMYDKENNIWHPQADNGGGGEAPIGVIDHTKVANRDKPDQHPIKAIIGLEDALVKAGTNNHFVCTSAPDDMTKVIKVMPTQVAPVDGSLAVVEFSLGNTAKNALIEIHDNEGVVLDHYIFTRNPARYSDLNPKDGNAIVSDIPAKYYCLVYFNNGFAYWVNTPCVRPLLIDFEQFGFNLEKILAGNQSIVPFKDGDVDLANEIKDKIAQSGGVFMIINQIGLVLKLGDLVDKGNDYSLSAYDGTSCYRFVCDYRRQRIMAEKIEVARATPIHTNFVVTAIKEGGGGYKADKTSQEIKSHYDNYGHVEMRYFDADTNQTKMYLYEDFDESNLLAIFRRVYLTTSSVNRVTIVVNENGNIAVSEEALDAQTVGLMNGKATRNVDFDGYSLTGVLKFGTNGPAPLFIGSTVESKATNAPRITAATDGTLAIVKADTIDKYVALSVGDPMDADHAVNKRYLDETYKNEMIDYLKSPEGKQLIKDIVAGNI